MALSPINPTQLTPPRVEFIDPRSGAISREWYRFFLSLLTATQTNQDEVELAPDATSLLATYDAMLASVAQTSEIASDGMVASLESSLNSLQNAFGVTPPDLGGTVTSVAASGGATGLTFTGSPITTSGTLTLGGTLAVASGGTGQISYTDGQLLIGNTTGNTLTKATLTAGTNVTITNGAGAITINATDAFVGTVTSVSVVSANGFAGTVANPTTTPAITLSTTVTGLVKGNGTTLSAAVAATDYVAPSAYASANGLTMATSRLLGRTTASTGAAEEISVAGGLTLSAGVLTGAAGTVTSVTGTSPVVSSGGATPAISMPAATTSVNGYLTSTDWNTFNNKGSGTVTSVTGTSPVVSSGGATPAISMPAATTSVNGYLTSTDWTTFNNKGSGTVTSVSGTGTVNGITLTGTVTSTGSLTLGGTLSGVSLTTQVSGTLPVANGGTGTATAFTAGSVVFAGASGVYTQDNANLFWDDTNNRLGINTATPASKLDIGSGDLRFSSTGQRILGDFSNGTFANRTAIQTTTASSATVIPIVPSASGFNVGINLETDPTFVAASVGQVIVVAGSEFRINSGIRGAGTYLPITFFSGGSERVRLDTSGNVGVGAAANASAILDVQSTTKGFRLPNMTTVQKNAIAAPAAGLMVFDTTLAKACVYSGAAWQTITSI
jgi:hypothetical protein